MQLRSLLSRLHPQHLSHPNWVKKTLNLLKSPLFLLGVLVLSTSLPLFSANLFPIHDFTHGARIVEMAIGLQEGQVPVRWSGHLGYGYGMPLFLFYAPLPYYVGATIYLLTQNVVLAIKCLFILSSIILASGAYVLGKEIWKKPAYGYLLAVTLMLAPYRAVNLYVRGAISEAWAMSFLPWVCWGAWQTLQGKKLGWFWFWLSLTALFLSHNLTTLMFVPLLGGFLVLYHVLSWLIGFTKEWKLPTLASLRPWFVLAMAGVLSVLSSAWYILPALSENSLTRINTIFTGYFHFTNHFLYLRQLIVPYWGYGGSNWGPDDGLSFFMGFGYLALIGVVVGVLIQRLVLLVVKPKDKPPSFMAKFFTWVKTKLTKLQTADVHSIAHPLVFMLSAAAMAGIALFLTTEKSLFIWNASSVIQTIQFPWRFLSQVGFWGVLAGVMALSCLQPKWQRVMMGVIAGLFLLNLPFFQPEKYLNNADAFYYSDTKRIEKDMSGVLPDYIPQTLDVKFAEKNIALNQPIVCDGCSAIPVLQVNRMHEKLLVVKGEKEKMVTLPIAAFPGWSGWIDGAVTSLGTSNQGLITVSIPSGEHTLSLQFGQTPVRVWGDVLSAAATLLVVITLIRQGYIFRQKHESPS